MLWSSNQLKGKDCPYQMREWDTNIGPRVTHMMVADTKSNEEVSLGEGQIWLYCIRRCPKVTIRHDNIFTSNPMPESCVISRERLLYRNISRLQTGSGTESTEYEVSIQYLDVEIAHLLRCKNIIVYGWNVFKDTQQVRTFRSNSILFGTNSGFEDHFPRAKCPFRCLIPKTA